MYNLSLFAERLNDLMFERNLTSQSLANILNVNVSTINHYLYGRFMPHTDLLIKIADFFNCSTDYLLGDGDDFISKKYNTCIPFCERLNFILTNKTCSQYKLHKETKIADSLITSWRRGIYIPSVDNLIKLADYFDCSVDFLLGRTNS